MNISIGNLANEIVSAMKEYTEDVSNGIAEEVNETAEKILAEVEITAPKKHGNYVKGFKKSNITAPHINRAVVWNKKYYRLVHLLEFGHAKRGGGRTRAFPHMAKAYEKYGVTLTDRLKQIIRSGGR
ncbi:MAG: hypothetical protein A2Y22_08665 [Clostridiales bacterium GWD2_32_59]|nr:MAG: hypothetical protein A2Y22_08665 [Clostridiales bacterium GWD2_32_59]